MAIPISTITAAIKAISVAGVTIRDTTELTDGINPGRDCPVLVPRPNGFVGLGAVERDTVGRASVARKTVTFTLAYRFFHSGMGQGRGEYDVFNDFVSKLFLIWDALIAADALNGTVDMTMSGMPDLGVVEDGAGKQFWGADIEVVCTVFINN